MKNQAYVEQKNGAVVLRLVSYARFGGVQAAQTLAHPYSVARLFVNCFQPSFKLKVYCNRCGPRRRPWPTCRGWKWVRAERPPTRAWPASWCS